MDEDNVIEVPYSKKRKVDTHCLNNDMDDYTHLKEVCRHKDFIFLSCEWHIYHSEHTTKLPYSTNQKGDCDTLYLPLEKNIMINVTKYHEVTFDEGNYFLANRDGVYDRTAQGTVLNFLNHCPQEKRLYIARSILVLDQQIADQIVKQLLTR